jgi:hypothetical protein
MASKKNTSNGSVNECAAETTKQEALRGISSCISSTSTSTGALMAGNKKVHFIAA